MRAFIATILILAPISCVYAESGIASVYNHRRIAASGEQFNPGGLTAAHRSLPFGTRVRVTHQGTGRSVVVRISDRGPFVRGRVIDLTPVGARALEDALLNFGGCAVIISHDRWFLDRIATHILAFEGDSKTVWCEGNYQAYEAQRKQRLGAEADQPHRIRYKKLGR